MYDPISFDHFLNIKLTTTVISNSFDAFSNKLTILNIMLCCFLIKFDCSQIQFILYCFLNKTSCVVRLKLKSNEMFNLQQVRILYEFLMMSWSVLLDYLQLLPLSWFLTKNPQDGYQCCD